MRSWIINSNPYFIVYFNLWFSKSFKIVFICINGITFFSMSKIIIQSNNLINIMNPWSYHMDCDVGFSHYKSPICSENSKIILKIHMMWSIHIIYYFVESFSHFIYFIFVPWSIIKLWQNYVVTHNVFWP
jgi:hypothetical protein